jgi:hypothetical protein
MLLAPASAACSSGHSAEEHLEMCDYSLHSVASRPAKVGDKLITTKFANTGTRGFSGIGEPDVAVCLLPGTEIAFESEAEYRNLLARLFSGFEKEATSGHRLARLFSGLRIAGEKPARFRQINLHDPQKHHDALEFADGRLVLLTQLCPGQRATVLQLPAQPHEAEAAAQKRSAVVS